MYMGRGKSDAIAPISSLLRSYTTHDQPGPAGLLSWRHLKRALMGEPGKFLCKTEISSSLSSGKEAGRTAKFIFGNLDPYCLSPLLKHAVILACSCECTVNSSVFPAAVVINALGVGVGQDVSDRESYGQLGPLTTQVLVTAALMRLAAKAKFV